MKMNTKSRMAIAAILDVAVHGTDRPVALASVGARQDISQSYLEQLFRKLRDRGYVSSTRGPGGGYRLNGRLSNISVADIVDAVDGNEDDQGSYARSSQSDDLWRRVNHHLHDYLSAVTLESVLEDAMHEQEPAPMASVPSTLSAAQVARMLEQSHAPGML